tara:strand:- start:483 stop:890 length:408 start_codon:yes stop_codon:yes gene_type:complete
MTATDTKLRQKIYDLVQDVGKDFVFYQNVGAGSGTYNPNTGTYGSIPSPTTHTIKATPPSAFFRRLAEGGTDVSGNVEITVPALNLNSTFESTYLRPKMKVTFDGGEWFAEAVEKIYSGDDICAYRVILSQASGA